MNKSRQQQPLTAQELYSDHRTDIARIMDLIGSELNNLDEEMKSTPGHWGHVGSIEHAREGLIETLAFLSNTQTNDIKNLLDGGRHEDDNPSPRSNFSGLRVPLGC